MLYLEVSLWIRQEIDDGCTKKDHSSRVDEERRPPAEIAGQEGSGETDRPPAAALGRRGAAKGIRAGDFAGNPETAPAEIIQVSGIANQDGRRDRLPSCFCA